jgi:hypothetical protein
MSANEDNFRHGFVGYVLKRSGAGHRNDFEIFNVYIKTNEGVLAQTNDLR